MRVRKPGYFNHEEQRQESFDAAMALAQGLPPHQGQDHHQAQDQEGQQHSHTRQAHTSRGPACAMHRRTRPDPGSSNENRIPGIEGGMSSLCAAQHILEAVRRTCAGSGQQYASRAACHHVTVKVPGSQPWQLGPGHRQRLLAELRARGMHVAGAHMRAGCIEIALALRPRHPQAQAQQRVQDHGSSSGSGSADVALDLAGIACAVAEALGLPPPSGGAGTGPIQAQCGGRLVRVEYDSSAERWRVCTCTGTGSPDAGAEDADGSGALSSGPHGADGNPDDTRGGTAKAIGNAEMATTILSIEPTVITAAAAGRARGDVGGSSGHGGADGMDAGVGAHANVGLRVSILGLPPCDHAAGASTDASGCVAVWGAHGFLPLLARRAAVPVLVTAAAAAGGGGAPGGSDGGAGAHAAGGAAAGPAAATAADMALPVAQQEEPEPGAGPGSGSGTDAGSTAPAMVVDVVLPPVRRAGLLLVAARPRPGAVLGCARPLLAAPSAAVAAELSALTSVWPASTGPGSMDPGMDELLQDLGSWWDFMGSAAAERQRQAVLASMAAAAGQASAHHNAAAGDGDGDDDEEMRLMSRVAAELVRHLATCACVCTVQQLASELHALGYGYNDVAPGKLLTHGSWDLLEAAHESGYAPMVELVEAWRAACAAQQQQQSLQREEQQQQPAQQQQDSSAARSEPRSPAASPSAATITPAASAAVAAHALPGGRPLSRTAPMAPVLPAATPGVVQRSGWCCWRLGFRGVGSMLVARGEQRRAFAAYLAEHHEARMVMLHLLTFLAQTVLLARVLYGARSPPPGAAGTLTPPPMASSPDHPLGTPPPEVQPGLGDAVLGAFNTVVHVAGFALWLASPRAYRRHGAALSLACRVAYAAGKALIVAGVAPMAVWVLRYHPTGIDLIWDVLLSNFCGMAPLLPWTLPMAVLEAPLNMALLAGAYPSRGAGWAARRAVLLLGSHVAAGVAAQACAWCGFLRGLRPGGGAGSGGSSGRVSIDAAGSRRSSKEHFE